MRVLPVSLSLLFVLSICQPTECAQVKPPVNHTETVTNSMEAPIGLAKQLKVSSPNPTELDAYKLLYQDSKDANNRIVTTMQWSIGFVTTFLLALIGSQIFFNYRLSKEEIALIRRDNEKLISDLSLRLDSDITSKLASIETNNENKRNELSKSIDRQADFSKKNIESTEKRLKNDMLEIKIDLERAIGHVWHLRGVEVNALRRFVDAALLDIRGGNGIAEYILDDILVYLGKTKDLESDLVKDLETLLSLVPNELSTIRDQIRAAIEEKSVYEHLENPDPITGDKFRYTKICKPK